MPATAQERQLQQHLDPDDRRAGLFHEAGRCSGGPSGGQHIVDQQDPLTGSQPTVRVLLREVTAFRLRFYADGRWQETWDRPQRLPQGLEITLTLANSGEITRLFLLTPGGGQ